MTQTEAVPPRTREDLVERARQGWIRRLVDFSRRNNLLYFRDLKRGTFDLTAHDFREMESLMNAGGVLVSRLVPLPPEAGPETEDERAQSLVAIRRRAQENLEERGLLTLFVAHGFATWAQPDPGRALSSAVLLFPAELEQRGRDGRQMTIRITGDAQVNLVLVQALQDLSGVNLDTEALLQPDDEGRIDLPSVFDRLRRACADVPGFAVDPRWVLGNFAFQKMALVRDLQEHGDQLVAHDLIAALAGAVPAREAIRGERRLIDASVIDQLDPGDEFLVMDADSSQQRVVLHVADGQDGVIQGPPGTGKSQVIVNLIASLSAQGKRVLFVAEKRAALDVVLRRLENAGLGHLALDLHGAELSRKQIMARVAAALVKVRESVPPAGDHIHSPFVEHRKRLGAHVARMHTPLPPSGRTVYQLEGELLALRDLQTAVRWRGPDLGRIDAAAERRILDLLVEAGGFGALPLRIDPGPWNGAELATGDDAQQAIAHATALAAGEWQAWRDALSALVAATGLPAPGTLTEARHTISLASRAAELGAAYDFALFAQDLEALRSGLAPANLGWLPALFARAFNGRYRRALKTARALRKTKASGKTLYADVLRAKDLAAEWGAATPEARPVVADVAPMAGAEAAAGPRLDWLDAHFERDLADIPLTDLHALIPGLAADVATPYRLPRLSEIESDIEALGAGAILPELRRLQPPSTGWGRIFAHAYLSSCLEEARRADAAIAGFNGRVHDQNVAEFCRLDRDRLKVAVDRVRRAHAEGAIATMNAYPEQDALIRREAQKKARHLPLRRLLAEAPDVLTALAPCWMASPLSVSQLLDGDQRYFDVVIFDEASQVLPEDAVSSLLRAQRAVVAGDSRQLPPTTFFAAHQDPSDGPADDDEPTEGFESLLDLMGAFLEPWPLQWHYRSRDEKLIAFSNHHIYDDSLITFPGPGGTAPVRHELVAQAPGSPGQEQSVTAEVDRVVELVIAHAEQRPKETLGVIAMGIEHADRVQRAIDQALLLRADLDPFFDQSLFERFFVKNLERVQGDERDAIILTIGYGKDERGRLPYRFGPLNNQGGERRLNVAITRARTRVTVVSSFSHHDMDPGRSAARGVELLRAYLEYAAQGGQSWADGARPEPALDAFKADVRAALEARGLILTPQWGASRYRVDFAVQSPDDEARFLLALETDGPGYRSVPTVRERDRTRQQVLEGLGWTFHRIWTTDWFMRRDAEIDRCLDAFHSAASPAGPEAPTPAPAEGAAPAAPSRSQRPRIGRRGSIDDYAPRELLAMVQWVESDGRLRTDEEIVDELVEELGFSRRGARIEVALRSAVQAYRTRYRS
jgi:very-short-patch-repair endonuclease